MKSKIAFISEHASPLATVGGVDSGGQNVYVAELTKQLATLGYEIDIFTRNDDPGLEKIVFWVPGVRVIHINAGPTSFLRKEDLWQHMPEFRDNMLRFIQREKASYELIHANFWMSGWVASAIKAILGVPFVITFHALGYIRKLYQHDDDKFPAIRISIEKEIVKFAEVIIAECPQDKQDLISYYMAPEERIAIVPCGFSKKEFQPISKSYSRKKLGLNPDEKIILQLGRMVARKGIDNVIRATSLLCKADTPVRLLVVGGDFDNPDTADYAELNRLKSIVSEEGIGDAVTFVGRKGRHILKYYYSAADVFVTTPWYEPFGITPLESMACGTPVIGSNVGGIKYSVDHGISGLLVSPENPEELAESIGTILSDAHMRQLMRIESIKRVNTMFTWQKVATLIRDQYRDVMASSQHELLPAKAKTKAA